MAYSYQAPLAHMRFVMEQVLKAPQAWQRCAAFAEVDADTAAAVLEEAAKFNSEILQPLNAVGDAQGCTLTAAADGSLANRVQTPTGFAKAYTAFVEGGWPALPCAPHWEGQGLPLLVDAALREMLSACNHGWNMYPDLLHGAYETLKAHGSDALKQRYLADIATGRTLAAMALTEPQAGSDLGALSTVGELQADGSLRVTGSKIFISGADHELTAQIVHLVLLRLPGAPPGSKGLSLALVPKFLPNQQHQGGQATVAAAAASSLGQRNTWGVTALEHKMGIHGSATCAVRYEGATGWLIGEPGRGLAAMFLMMNSARLHVGLQGLGHLEMATQNAQRYAQERQQFGRPLAQMPAVQQCLASLGALTQGLRVIAYRAALAIDEAHHHPDEASRTKAGRLAALLTPIVKAACTHYGFEGAAQAQQVWGGYGYVHETGIEQTVRDARIAMVYEGTNEIQAIDLLQRKVLADGGAAFDELMHELGEELHLANALAQAQPQWQGLAQALQAQMAAARCGVTQVLAAKASSSAHAANDFLHGLSHTLFAWAWVASARAASACQDLGVAAPLLAHAQHGCRWLLPQAQVHWQRVTLVCCET